MGGSLDDEAIEHPWLSRAIENAQKKVENHNFDIRKHLLQYDDVMNMQRKVIYGLRKRILETKDQRAEVEEFLDTIADGFAVEFAGKKGQLEEWDFAGLNQASASSLYFPIGVEAKDIEEATEEGLFKAVRKKLSERYEAKRVELGDFIHEVEKMFMLSTIDHRWKEHLLQMDHLREGIGLRGYAQKDPLLEYKKESFFLFQTLQGQVRQEVIAKILTVQLRNEAAEEEIRRYEEEKEREIKLALNQGEKSQPEQGSRGGQTVSRDEEDRIGRNDPCPCGSGKKYKKCHGR
jgi:preprotein translocase subunit SecA